MNTAHTFSFVRCRQAVAAALLCAVGASTMAADRPYDMKVVDCEKGSTDVLCISWDLETMPGASRYSWRGFSLKKGETMSGVIKPKSNRITSTKLLFETDVEFFVAEGVAPTEEDYLCKGTKGDSCAVSGRNKKPLHFLAKATGDSGRVDLWLTYDVSQ